MDIDKILDDIANQAAADNSFPDSDDLSNIEFKELLTKKYTTTDAGRRELYKRFYKDVTQLIDKMTASCPDPHAADGMYKCSLESWQAIITQIGYNYFYDNKLLEDYERQRVEGGRRYEDNKLYIGLQLYEDLCNQYHKQFFIYDCCKFLGIMKEYMYKLNDLHSNMLKKAHTAQEGSMRAALASGRSNVTAMAILLNHDYDYTRTTQVIHTTDNKQLSAGDLPQLLPDDLGGAAT